MKKKAECEKVNSGSKLKPHKDEIWLPPNELKSHSAYIWRTRLGKTNILLRSIGKPVEGGRWLGLNVFPKDKGLEAVAGGKNVG